MQVKTRLLAVAFAAALAAVAPRGALAAEMKIIPGLVQMLQNGQVSYGKDKKVLVDEKGDIVARQLDQGKAAKPLAGAEAPFVCTPSCGIWVKRCYSDPKGVVMCINLCEKELFLCEQ